MRIRGLLCFLLFLTAYSAAQDTNFAAGPQYLLIGSPLLVHSIATPSLSLDAPLPPIEPLNVSPLTVSSPEATNAVAYTTNPQLEHQANLIPIYYGEPNYYRVPEASVVEISFPEGATQSGAGLPASIVESGVTQFVDPQVLPVRGYGAPLGDVAAYWKSHRPPVRHGYTNEDIKRLHSAG